MLFHWLLKTVCRLALCYPDLLLDYTIINNNIILDVSLYSNERERLREKWCGFGWVESGTDLGGAQGGEP